MIGRFRCRVQTTKPYSRMRRTSADLVVNINKQAAKAGVSCYAPGLGRLQNTYIDPSSSLIMTVCRHSAK